MKIVEIIPSLKPVGGAEVFITNFCSELNKNKNIKLKLIIINNNQNNSYLVSELSKSGVDICFLSRKNSFDIAAYIRLKKIVREFKPDIIHSHLYSLTTLYFSGIFRNIQKKHYNVYQTIHNSNPCSKTFFDKLQRKLILKHKVLPICVSRSSAEIYSRNFSMNFAYVNNGISTDKFDSSMILKKREIDFLCVGRFASVKNQKYVIDCIKKNSSLLKYKFLFVGNGEHFESIKYEATNLDNVDFIKHEDNPEKLMSRSKVLLVPSLMEGNPMVINEAVASGMIVVANNVGGIPDVIKYKKEKYLTTVNDKDSFIKAMIDAVEEANHIDRLIYEQDILNSISITECVNNYLEVFKSL